MELRVLAIFLTLTISGAQQSQLEGPENTLSAAGSTVTLRCVSPSRNCHQIDWLKFVPDANAMNVFSDRVGIYYAFKDRYSVDNSSGCHLVIKNVNLTDAGRFICRTFISSQQTEKAASLIIMKSQPKCMINAPENSIAEGDGVPLLCEVTYNATTRASMVWKGKEYAPAAVENGGTISRSYSAIASLPVVPSFTCATSFAAENGYLEIAANIPVVTCTTPATNVLYSVRNVTLSPSLPSYPPRTIINCLANGYPSPIFKWQVMETDGTWMDIQTMSQFLVMNLSSKLYRCLAINVVRGRSYNSASHVFMVNNTLTDELASNAKPQETEGSAGVTMGVGIGIGFLVAVVLATVAFAILIRLGYLEFLPKPAKKSQDDTAKNSGEKLNPSFHQLTANDPLTHRAGASFVVEQDSSYTGLREGRDVIQYESLE